MAVPPTSPAGSRRKIEECESKQGVPSPAKRSKNPGVRVQGGRIYDSQNGSTCHQCRQKTMDFAASCKAMKGKKPCTIKFCHKCLLNRYGEKAEEVSALGDWNCPKCRGLCNCSFCMKKNGLDPTGILVHRAKLTGFSSVHDLLSKGDWAVENEMNNVKTSPVPKMVLAQTKRSRDQENVNIEKKNPLKLTKSLKKDEKSSKRLKQTDLVTESGVSDVGNVKKKLQINNPEIGLSAQEDNKNDNFNNITKDENEAKVPKRCHQCRQQKMNFAASCKAMKREKSCNTNYCHSCLLKRYGEKAEEVSALDDWNCPKCRGLCNCSFCMKKKEMLKLTGFSSVQEFLRKGGKNIKNEMRDVTTSPKKSPAQKMDQRKSKRCMDMENCNIEKHGSVIPSKNLKKNEKSSKILKQTTLVTECGMSEGAQTKRKLQFKNPENGLSAQDDYDKENLKVTTKDKAFAKFSKSNGQAPNIITKRAKEVVRPQGKPLRMVAGVEMPGEDVGPALQFLEFCKVFSKVLNIKKGEPEAIIRELVRGFSSQRRCRVSSAIIQFQIRLLSFILEDLGEASSLEMKGENSWLKALGKCFDEYKHLSVEFPLDLINDYSGYNNLNSSIKLRILLFLCDEVLNTEVLRKFLDEENAKFVEEEKGKRDHISAARRKEKHIKQTLRDELAKSMISSGVAQLSISEHEKLISKIRYETEKAHQEMLESTNLLTKKRQAPDAIRAIPVLLEKDGLVFWRLKSYDKSSSIVLQDIEKWSMITPQDRWFIFDEDEKELVEKYISSLRSQKAREEKEYQKRALVAFGMEDNSLDTSQPSNCLVEVN